MLTMGSNVFTNITHQLVKDAIEAGQLDLCAYPLWTDPELLKALSPTRYHPEGCRHWMWQDRQTGGGGCRIVVDEEFKYLWLSSHSGYPNADFTEAMKEILLMLGAKEVAPGTYGPRNPHVYGD